jgi:hypothetical protein
MIYKILGFVILPALLTAFFASIIPRKLKERQRFNEAAKTFQDAFVPQLSFLKHNTNIGGIGSTDDISELLSFGYVHYHLKAFEVFKGYLSTKKRADIDKAWQKCYYPDDPKILNVSRFSNKSSNGEQKSKEELKKLTLEAIERIEEILKFAKHK